jgi:hypothetical protein
MKLSPMIGLRATSTVWQNSFPKFYCLSTSKIIWGGKNISYPTVWQILFPKTQKSANKMKSLAKRTKSSAKHEEKD